MNGTPAAVTRRSPPHTCGRHPPESTPHLRPSPAGVHPGAEIPYPRRSDVYMALPVVERTVSHELPLDRSRRRDGRDDAVEGVASGFLEGGFSN